MSVFFVRHNENSQVCSQKHWLILFKRSKLVSKINKSRKFLAKLFFSPFIPPFSQNADCCGTKQRWSWRLHSSLKMACKLMPTVSFIFYICTNPCLFLTFGSQIIQSVLQWAQRWTRPTFQHWKHHTVINSVGFKGQSNRNRSLDVTWLHAKVL